MVGSLPRECLSATSLVSAVADSYLRYMPTSGYHGNACLQRASYPLSRIVTLDTCLRLVTSKEFTIYTGCPRRNVPDFGKIFLMLKYADITQNTYVHIYNIYNVYIFNFCKKEPYSQISLATNSATRVRFLAGETGLPLFCSVQTASEAHPSSYTMCIGQFSLRGNSNWNVKPTSYLM
jgi:hypothetical protein